MITAVGVVVLARDEVDRVAACLHGLQRALHPVPPAVEAAVHLVLDRCSPRTAAVVAEIVADAPGWTWEVVVDERPAGRLRHEAASFLLRRLQHHDPARVWLLGTDSDAVVPADWILRHLDHSRRGMAAVSGLVEPGEEARVADVHGANLGVRADAYLAAGGFLPDGPRSEGGSDLVDRVRCAGFPVVHPADVRVTALPRLPRLDGQERGLADVLAALAPDVTPA